MRRSPLLAVAVPCTLALLYALLCAPVRPALAAEPFASAGEAGQWIMYYYKSPEPERLSQALAVLAESRDISEDGNKLIVSFIGAALARAPQAQEGFYKDVAAAPRLRFFALPCFWFMADDAGKKLMERARKEWTGQGEAELAAQLLAVAPPDLLGGDIESLLHLDHLWSMFFATGDAEPVLKIASAMPLMGNENVRLHLIGQAASMSVAANARTHPRVREIVEQAAEGAEEPLKSKLRAALLP
ncbi:MAG: hypothetical protein AB7D51_07585 [Desulfovibrionaceae bacterium]